MWYMKATVDFCDFTQKVYRAPVEGAWLVKEIKNGIFEAKLACGPEYIEQHKIKPLTEEKCRMLVESRGGVLQF